MTKTKLLRLLLAATVAVCPLTSFAQGGQGGSANYSTLVNATGQPLAGVSIAVCGTLATSAAAVSGNIATLTVSSTTGFTSGMTLNVSGFTAGDTYFNGTFTIAGLSATTLSYALTHANASAGTNGKAYQTGNSATPCAPLSSVYSEGTLTTVLANPFTSDGVGNWNYWAAPGNYEVQFYGSSVTTTLYQVQIPAQLSSNNTWTGINAFSGGISGSVVFSGTVTLASPIINGTPTGTGIQTITQKKGSGGGTYTTSSTSYVDVDGTNLAYTVNIPTGWKLLIAASGSGLISTAADSMGVALTDGSLLTERVISFTAININTGWALNWAIAGDGLSHTVKLQFKTFGAADAANIRNANGTDTCVMDFTLAPSN